MFRNLSGSRPPPFHNTNLRRRQQVRQESNFRHNSLFDCPFSGAGEVDGALELSMHHPIAPSNNRFSALATPPPTLSRDREYYASGHHHRSRNSRGTREAKKRRDIRRNRRKFAAQLLDEQLSRDIDQTLTNNNFPPVPTIAASPDPPKASFTFTWPSWIGAAPTPPQLPLLDFGNLDFDEFTCFAPGKQRSPLTPPAGGPDVPNWCPYIPSLMQTGSGWDGDVPRFTDLSSLPERKELPKYDSPQLGSDKGEMLPKKQSRFFPTLTTSVSAPIVKLPPTQCKLHRTEQEVQDSMRYTAWTITDDAVPPQHFKQHASYGDGSTIAQHPLSNMWPEAVSSEPIPYANHNTSRVDESTKTAAHFEQSRESPEDSAESLSSRLASAANLWRILNDGGILAEEQTMEDERRSHNLRSGCEDSEDSGGVPIYQAEYQQTVAELDSTEIPYVHLNSLTGHANESGQYHSTADHDLVESVLYLAEFFATPRSVTPTCEMAAPSPYTASSPCLHLMEAAELSTVATNHVNSRSEISDEMRQSSDHYSSEQELFRPEEIMLPVSRNDTPCDLDTFLSMGHDETCWCRDCNEVPESIEKEELEEDDDDDWLDWSTLGDETDESDESSTTGAPQTATITDVSDDDEQGCARFPCASAPEWDKLYPYTPDRQESQQEDEKEFLGYYDDGAAFAQDNEYEGWWTGC